MCWIYNNKNYHAQKLPYVCGWNLERKHLLPSSCTADCIHANVKTQSFDAPCLYTVACSFLDCLRIWSLWVDAWHCPLWICDLRFVIKGNNGSPLGLVIYNGWFNLFHFYLVNCKLIIKIWILICHQGWMYWS